MAEGLAREQRQKNEEMETQSNRDEEREERGEDRGRDALGRDIQDTQKRVGTQRMTKMQKVGGEAW